MHRVGNGKARRTAAAAVAAVALLTGTAACGGADGGADGGPAARDGAAAPTAASPGGSPAPGGSTDATPGAAPGAAPGATPGASADRSGAPGPGAEQLASFALAPGEKAGEYETGEPFLDEPMSELYDAAPAVCGPLTSLGKAGHTAQAYTKTDVPTELRAVGTDILLRSYDGGGAAAAMKSLAAAGRQCAGGYTEDRAIVTAKVLRVEPVGAPALGDEALAFRIVVQDVKDEGISLYKYLTVIRSGAVTLSFRSDAIDTRDFGGVPQDVVAAQWAKFTKASGKGS